MEKTNKVGNALLIESMLRSKTKIFSHNEDALKYCAALKVRSKMPYKYIIVTWDE